ncbi:hypothetical protein BDL97_15G075100 [Sphagnum fallax]|nr:hypothetical protein BDL97_15G075100 [Sphagnum fallax]
MASFTNCFLHLPTLFSLLYRPFFIISSHYFALINFSYSLWLSLTNCFCTFQHYLASFIDPFLLLRKKKKKKHFFFNLPSKTFKHWNEVLMGQQSSTFFEEIRIVFVSSSP